MKRFFTEIPTLGSDELKKFGLLLAGFIALVFGGLLSYGLGKVLIWPWVVSVVLVILSSLNSGLLLYVYRVWMVLARLLGHLIAVLTLILIFFLLVTPIGLVFRIARRRKSAATGWLDSDDSVHTDFERPY